MNDAAATSPWPVRPVRADDLGDLRRIAESAFCLDAGDRAGLVDLFARRLPDGHTLGLLASHSTGTAGFAFGSRYGDRGFVDMLAVAEPVRRQGMATALLDHLEGALFRAGAVSVSIGGNGHVYAWPGVDVGYASALALARRRGYRQRGEAHNMRVDLGSWHLGTSEQVLERHGGRVRARRASNADWPALSAFVTREFTAGWRDEVALAMRREVPGVFVATREGAIVGFACHGVYRAGWFGPIGTAAAERGAGVGEALLRLCLDDLAGAGARFADISWVGPTGFYTRTVGARPGRRFVILTKGADVTAPARQATPASRAARTPGR